MGFKHLTEQPTAPSQFNPNLSPFSEVAILKAMAKQRTGRHADISAFLAALRAPSTQFTVPAQAPILPSLTREQWLYVGNDHYKAGHCDEAVAAYEQAMRLDPNYALAYSNKGFVLCEFQRYDEALTVYEQAIRLDPDSALAYNNRGQALVNLQRYEEALVAYEQAIRLDPNYVRAYNNKGVVLEKLGRRKEAQQAYKKAQQLSGNR
jgi:tetratricopeptide (TPR) repeat protein